MVLRKYKDFKKLFLSLYYNKEVQEENAELWEVIFKIMSPDNEELEAQ